MKGKIKIAKSQRKAIKLMMEQAGVCSLNDLIEVCLSLGQWTLDETFEGNDVGFLTKDKKTFKSLVHPNLLFCKELSKEVHRKSKEDSGKNGKGHKVHY